MAFTNTTKNDLLKMVCKGIDPAWRASPNLYIALLTADPTSSGSFTSEATYGGYARVAIDKATAWTDSGTSFANALLVQANESLSDTNTITHFAFCTALTGGQMLSYGSLGTSKTIASGDQPQFKVGQLSISGI